jgi:hypothetical protein
MSYQLFRAIYYTPHSCIATGIRAIVLPNKAARRDVVQPKFWRDHAATSSINELLCPSVPALVYSLCSLVLQACSLNQVCILSEDYGTTFKVNLRRALTISCSFGPQNSTRWSMCTSVFKPIIFQALGYERPRTIEMCH